MSANMNDQKAAGPQAGAPKKAPVPNANGDAQEPKSIASPSAPSFGTFSFKNALAQASQGAAPSAPLTGVSIKPPTPTQGGRNAGGKHSQQPGKGRDNAPHANNANSNGNNNRRRNSNERSKPQTPKEDKPQPAPAAAAQPVAVAVSEPVAAPAAVAVPAPAAQAVPAPAVGGLMFGSLPPRVQSAPPKVDDPAIVSMQKATTSAAVPESAEDKEVETVNKTEEVSQVATDASAPAPGFYHPQQQQQQPHHHQQQHYPQQGYYGQPYYHHGGAYHPQQHRYPNQNPYYTPKYNNYQAGGYYQGGYRPYYNNRHHMPAPMAPVDAAPVAPVAAADAAIAEPQPQPVVAPAFVAPVVPARKKIAIVDPDTGKEVDLGVLPKIVQPEGPNSPAQVSSPSAAPRKPLVLVDPNSNKPIDLSQMTRAEAQQAVADDEALALPEIDEKDAFEGGLSDSGYSYSSSSAFSEGEDDDLLDEFPSGMEFPVILTRDLKVEYPADAIPFTLPPEGEPIKYTNEFLLQFEHLCKGAAQDIKAIAFPDQVIVRQNRSAGRHGKGGHRSGHRHHHHQQQYSAEQLTLTNRAENAWKRLKDSVVEADVHVVIEVKGLLNKISENNFENITEKILAQPILNSDAVLSQVIDLFFDKAVEEPRYAPLYSRLCSRITDAEIEKKKMTQSAEEFAASEKNIASHSMFRKLLVTKCQQEYEAKQAYSKSRIERLMTKAIEAGQISAEASTASLAAMTTGGDLTEEDYALLKTKRRVLGNMRFIGELFIARLIGSKIMYTVIQELLTEIVEPEEEEVESACRLISTVGPILDAPESAALWTRFANRMGVLAENKKLPTRVRFMLLDVLESRAQGWRKPGEQARPAAPTTSASPAPSAASARSAASSTGGRPERGGYRGERGGDRDRDFRRDHRDDARSGSARFSSKRDAPNASNQDVRFEKVVSKGGANRSRPSSTQPEDVRPPSRPSSTINESSNRYLALEEDSSPATSPVITEASSTAATPSDFNADATFRKLCGVLEESMKQKNYDDVVAIFSTDVPANHRGDALKALTLHVMDHGKTQVEFFVNVIATLLIPHLTSDMVKSGLSSAWEMIDDLAVDLPQAWEFAGMILAVFVNAKLISIADIAPAVFPQLTERDPAAVGKVILYTLKFSQSPAEELKETVKSEALLSANRSQLDSLITRLELVHLF